jgi:flagellar basal body-associated protein FliL
MAGSWESSKKKRAPVAGMVTAAGIGVVVAFLVVNNVDVFNREKPVAQDTAQQKQATPDSGSESVKALDSDTAGQLSDRKKAGSDLREQREAAADTVVSARTKKKNAAKQPPAKFSVDLPGVKCALADREGVTVRVSLRIYGSGVEFEKEVLFKRDNLAVLVKKLFSTLYLDEIVVDDLREKLRKDLNALLEKGKVSDIEFLDFRPVSE